MLNIIGKNPMVANVDSKIHKVGDQKVQAEKIQSDKVEKISQAVKSGSYKVDLQATSEKMALNLLGL